MKRNYADVLKSHEEIDHIKPNVGCQRKITCLVLPDTTPWGEQAPLALSKELTSTFSFPNMLLLQELLALSTPKKSGKLFMRSLKPFVRPNPVFHKLKVTKIFGGTRVAQAKNTGRKHKDCTANHQKGSRCQGGLCRQDQCVPGARNTEPSSLWTQEHWPSIIHWWSPSAK